VNGRVISASIFTLVVGLSVAWAQDKKPAARESTMTDRLPKVGTAVPDLEIFDETGMPFSTGQFKDHYTVLVFGCLT
jgi:cytochrome oxidase Cu insertion factor (SCO1/SenC/PrrC family)